MEFDPTIDRQYEAEAAHAANYAEFQEQTERCHCGCEQLLTELNHIRSVEIPHMETEYQAALWLLKQYVDAAECNDSPDASIAREATALIEARYIAPVPPSTDPDKLPF